MNPGTRNLVAGLLALAATGVLAVGAAIPLVAPAPAPVQGQVPTECLAERNHGACVNCCKDKTGLDGSICTRFCRNDVPPPPESQP